MTQKRKVFQCETTAAFQHHGQLERLKALNSAPLQEKCQISIKTEENTLR